MAAWKCKCRQIVDESYDRCPTCARWKPGFSHPEDLEFEATFIYRNRGNLEFKFAYLKGPVIIGTDRGHSCLQVKTASNVEVLSFPWENTFSHGTPIQVIPLVEGGYRMACTNECVSVNGGAIRNGDMLVESGSILLMGTSMAIKFEDYRQPSMIEGSISPVGNRLSDNIDGSRLFRIRGADMEFMNGLCEDDMLLYENNGVAIVTSTDRENWDFVNRSLLSIVGQDSVNYRLVKKKLKCGMIGSGLS